jgi:tetratricopeptide (TPR) repeat protein
MNVDDIYEILDMAYESDDADEVAELVERALALEPDNPEALLLKADLVEDDEERLDILESALKEARRYFKEEGLHGDDILEDELGLVYLGLLQRAAFVFFVMERDDRSFELVKELLSYNHEEQGMAKTLYYRILLEREEWSHVLEETMKETTRGLGWAYARMIASFMLSGAKDDAALEKIDKMLWDAVRISPNVPFYILG